MNEEPSLPKNPLERAFEWLIWNARFVVILAVVASLIGMLMLFLLAAENVFLLFRDFLLVLAGAHEDPEFHTRAVAQIISAVDDFLLGTVMLIFALGLYELFISRIDIARSEKNAQNILMIRTLDDLKDRLAKVVLMILVVAFFKNVLHVKFDDPLNILFMGGGILLVSLATYYTHKAGQH